MFATSSGTPYGGYSIDGAPNGSSGGGRPELQGRGPPAPSGGFLPPSVYNKTSDTVPNDIPSVVVVPSQNTQLCTASNAFMVSDLVLVAVARDCPEGVSYSSRRNRPSTRAETVLMTINKANEELRRFAREWQGGAGSRPWFADPLQVSNWIRPMGAVLSVQKAGDRISSTNVCVSRRALVRHTFMSTTDSSARSLHAQNMDHASVMYALTKCQLQSGTEHVDVVQIWTVAHDSTEDIYTEYKNCVTVITDIGHAGGTQVHTRKDDVNSTRKCVFVQIGRVLHSPPRCPSIAECQLACLCRTQMHAMATIEIQLGCP
jgi:hypothetical protein